MNMLLPANVLPGRGRAGEDSGTHVGDLQCIPGSLHWPGPVLAVASIREANQWMEDFSLFLSFLLTVSLYLLNS